MILITGCFDILHAGHFHMFAEARKKAKECGDIVVLLDSDERIKEAKGTSRPFNTWDDRRWCLSNIKGIEYKNIYSLNTDIQLIDFCKFSKPLRIIGEEYMTKEILGGEFCSDIIYVKKYKDLSTTRILGENNEKSE